MNKKYNILLITSDQQHYNTIGAFNNEIQTPNLDRLVQEGTYYNRAYCPNPTCTPTRASIITGKYPSQHGAWTLGTMLPLEEHFVGDDFQQNNYRTALIGKAHFMPLASTPEYPSIEYNPLQQDLDYWRQFNGPFYGFEQVELARNHTTEFLVGQHYAVWMEDKGFTDWKKHFHPPTGTMDPKQEHTWHIPEEYHYDAWIAERTCHMLDEYKKNDEPFFLWSSFLDPHPPYFVPQPWDTMYDPDSITLPSITPGEHDRNPPHFGLTQEGKPNFDDYRESGFTVHGFHSHSRDEKTMRKDMAVYYGMISLMDKYIGKITDHLDRLGLAENTIVVFSTDHGHFFGHHGLTAKGPFHYEELIRVPLIVRCPGTIPSSCVSDALQSLVDFAPTFLDFCNIELPKDMTGVSQKQVWLGERDRARDHVLCENHHEPTTVHLKTYVENRYKITVYYNQTYGELYDLKNDPKEINNGWDHPEYKEIKSNLLLKFIWAELGKEPMWMPRIWGA